MAKPNIESLAARLDVQAIVLQELARVLTPAQSTAVADAVRVRVAELAEHRSFNRAQQRPGEP
jgi:hypothetical protein